MGQVLVLGKPSTGAGKEVGEEGTGGHKGKDTARCGNRHLHRTQGGWVDKGPPSPPFLQHQGSLACAVPSTSAALGSLVSDTGARALILVVAV